MSRLAGIVLHLLSEQSEKGKRIHITDPTLTNKLKELRELSKLVYSSLVKYIEVQNRGSISKSAFRISWSSVPEELQQKYVLILEEKALKEYELDLGRCIDS